MCISLYLAAKTNNADETSIARVVSAAFLIEFITASIRSCALSANKPIGSPLVGIVYWPTRAMIAGVKKNPRWIHHRLP